MGKLLNFNWLIYPQFLRTWVCDISATGHFILLQNTDIEQLLFEYRELFKFVCETAGECQDNLSGNHFVQNNLLISMEVNSLSCIHSFPMLCHFQLLKQS